MSVMHFLVRDKSRVDEIYKIRCTRDTQEDTRTISIDKVTCWRCIELMTPEEDMQYRLSKVSYGELEEIVRRVSDAYNGVDNIFEIGKLADDTMKKLPGHSRNSIEGRGR